MSSNNKTIDTTGETNISQEMTTVTQQVTTFADNATVTKILSAPYDTRTNNPFYISTIAQWLERPHNVATLLWDSTTFGGNRLKYISFPQILFSIPSFRDKIANFTYFRSNIVVGFRLNGSRFHYGKLVAAWRPRQAISSFPNATGNMYTHVHGPFLTLSPTDNEVIEYEIPYTLPFDYLRTGELNSPEFEQAGLSIFVMNPLAIASTDTVPPVTLTIFARFKDPILGGYNNVGLPAYSQITDPNWLYGEPIIGTDVTLIAQAGEAVEKSERGLVSGVAEDVAVISKIATLVPGVSPYASIISDVSSAVGTVANYFGYNKPLSQIAIAPRQITLGSFSHSKGIDSVQALSLSPDCKLKSMLTRMGSYSGEMLLANYASRPGYLGYANWTSFDASEDIILTIPTIPSISAVKPGSVEYVYLTPLASVMRMCRYWRGTLRYCISISCSQFHAGRLRISWTPYADFTNSFIGDVVSKIVDISSETEVYFSVPFMFIMPVYGRLNATSQVGALNITVLNELTSPYSPTNGVYVNAWVAGAPDNQFYAAYPVGSTKATSLMTQVGTRETMLAMDYPSLIPSTPYESDDVICGEQIIHFGDLFKRYCYLNIVSQDTFSPFSPPVRGVFSDPEDGSLVNSFSFLNNINDMFEYRRGSHSFKLIRADPTVNAPQASATTYPNVKNYTSQLQAFLPSSAGLAPYSAFSLAYETAINFMSFGVNIPYISNLPFLHNNTIPFFIRYNAPVAHIDANVDCYFLFAGGDDLEYGLQIGSPIYDNIII